MSLPGVKVGPLDPEATAEFGQVAAHNSARVLLRLHSRMYPPALRRVLAKSRDEERSAGLDLDEVRGYVGGLNHPNGDPIVPEGARVVGAAVAGDELTGWVLRFQYELPSGRIGKWYAPYGEDELPESFSRGSQRARAKDLRERGLVAFDDPSMSGTNVELLRRKLAAAEQENERLRLRSEGVDPAERADDAGKISGAGGREAQSQETHLAEVEQMRRELEESRERQQQLEQRNAQLETLAATAGGEGSMNVGGLEADIPDRDAQARGPEPDGEPAEDAGDVPAEPPFEGYDNLNAPDVVARIRAEETSDEDVERILAYERGHAGRATITSAAERRLDRSQG